MITLEHVSKCYGDREIINIDKLEIYDGEKVGIVGKNGVGKSTLLDIISGNCMADTGKVKVSGSIGYIKQFSDDIYSSLSGGELEKKEINKVFSEKTDIILADEPSSNLDIASINYIIKRFKEFDGTILLISHDRSLIDEVCSKIIEIENGKVTTYYGNYTEFKRQKEFEKNSKEERYNEYIREKQKLERAINVSKNTSKKMKKTPSRMGNSEARLHKREAENKREKLEGHTKALQSRLEKLDVVEKEIKELPVYMKVPDTKIIKAKFAITGKNVSIKYDDNIILDNVSFNLHSNKITALIGKNGVGKTSLVKRIIERDENIYINNNVDIGYFSQSLDVLDDSKTVLENVTESSIQNEITVRNILANLYIKGNDVFKKVGNLSGGEKVKVAITKLLVNNYNLLILDEPTNFLDIYSIEALERLLKMYVGTILLISHDERLINNVCNYLFLIEDKKIVEFDGNYTAYLDFKKRKAENRNIMDKKELNVGFSSDLLLLDIKISEIISKLSYTKNEAERVELEREYEKLTKEKNRLKRK